MDIFNGKPKEISYSEMILKLKAVGDEMQLEALSEDISQEQWDELDNEQNVVDDMASIFEEDQLILHYNTEPSSRAELFEYDNDAEYRDFYVEEVFNKIHVYICNT